MKWGITIFTSKLLIVIKFMGRKRFKDGRNHYKKNIEINIFEMGSNILGLTSVNNNIGKGNVFIVVSFVVL